MLKLMVQREADVARGRTIPQERVFADLKARLTATTDALLNVNAQPAAPDRRT